MYGRMLQEWADDVVERGGLSREEAQQRMNTVLADTNYSQLEMRLFAELSNE
jgi:polyhydroxyalkanoate synthesis regulator phasin